VVDPAQAPVVRRIFGEFVAGRSQSQITRDLNADGIPTVRGGKWYQGTVAKLLRLPLYVGKFTYNGEVLDTEEVPPIIDPETWGKAQALLSRSSEDTGKVDTLGRKITRGRGRGSAGRHLFRKGLLRCSCGSAMTPFTRPNRTPGAPPYEAYVCLGRKNGLQGCACTQEAVRRELIDPAIWTFFERVALDTEATREAIVRAHAFKLAELDALRHQAEQDQVQAQARLARVEGDYLDAKLDVDAWHRFNVKLGADLNAATAQLAQLDAQRPALTDDLDQWRSRRPWSRSCRRCLPQEAPRWRRTSCPEWSSMTSTSQSSRS
jgi:hypothetical protein